MSGTAKAVGRRGQKRYKWFKDHKEKSTTTNNAAAAEGQQDDDEDVYGDSQQTLLSDILESDKLINTMSTQLQAASERVNSYMKKK